VGTVKVRVIDISGRVVEMHDNVPSNNTLRIGERLASGSYFIEVNQNNEQKIIKVLKFD
jgi:Secretion system C-terminal sorting domain